MREEIENIPSDKTATEKAVEKLEEAIIGSENLSPEEIEKEILAVPGVEEGSGLEKMRKKSKNKKETIH